jgi:hypothetical protein
LTLSGILRSCYCLHRLKDILDRDKREGDRAVGDAIRQENVIPDPHPSAAVDNIGDIALAVLIRRR